MCEDLTGELRSRLDALGVEWQDWSDDYPVLNGNGDQRMRIHIERTGRCARRAASRSRTWPTPSACASRR